MTIKCLQWKTVCLTTNHSSHSRRLRLESFPFLENEHTLFYHGAKCFFRWKLNCKHALTHSTLPVKWNQTFYCHKEGILNKQLIASSTFYIIKLKIKNSRSTDSEGRTFKRSNYYALLVYWSNHNIYIMIQRRLFQGSEKVW